MRWRRIRWNLTVGSFVLGVELEIEPITVGPARGRRVGRNVDVAGKMAAAPQ